MYLHSAVELSHQFVECFANSPGPFIEDLFVAAAEREIIKQMHRRIQLLGPMKNHLAKKYWINFYARLDILMQDCDTTEPSRDIRHIL